MGQEELTPGRFITFEGGEGAGKSTQVKLLIEDLARAKVRAKATREPGGAPGSEAIRRLLVEGEPDRWDPVSEALLATAARRAHLQATIWPTLEQGIWVICDRFADSTMAYQGYGGGVPAADLAALYRIVADDFAPDLTFILDLPVELGLERAGQRSGSETRFERMDRAFHERLRQGFLAIARNEPQRCVVIDATAAVDTVQSAVRAAILSRLGLKL